MFTNSNLTLAAVHTWNQALLGFFILQKTSIKTSVFVNPIRYNSFRFQGFLWKRIIYHFFIANLVFLTGNLCHISFLSENPSNFYKRRMKRALKCCFFLIILNIRRINTFLSNPVSYPLSSDFCQKLSNYLATAKPQICLFYKNSLFLNHYCAIRHLEFAQ